MKKLLGGAFLAGMLAIAFPAHASVSLLFSDPTLNGGQGYWASGFYNHAGSATSASDGLYWGIVIDTSKNGFAGNGSSATYSAFATPTTAGFLSVNGVATDDYFIPSTAFNSSSSFNTTQDATGNGNGGHGTIQDTSTNNISLTGPLAGASGDPFSLIWFNNATQSQSMAAGQFYGMMTAADFVLPTDGSTTDLAGTDFSGPLTARSANLTFTASGVPEPTSSMLALVGFAGLFLRRRRV